MLVKKRLSTLLSSPSILSVVGVYRCFRCRANQEILQFRDGRTTFFLLPSDIILFQSWGDYVRIITVQDILTIKTTLKELECFLPQQAFIRIHRSCIIQMDQVRSIDAQHVKLKNGEQLAIGKNYKNRLFDRLGIQSSLNS
ncbi:LytR/AlgR family response regulator transcription factor [Sphingobacterium psychroaquaticum]|uniref:LytTr DNA-binding domain-containing protein n=1 Tax=Sphingobacterium psychroaquaticum TaxID=561061 RepID=A0A1X7ILF0_9SPHI|nr:LytTR family transcriptional regulator [Sphingobacterium psychroaquaticum]SMG15518.1 LytTr DNA-binding domain-containing protein [Sphingobacterium psychroaquaticum]